MLSVRNSWGPSFGDGGYIRLPIGHNACGVLNFLGSAKQLDAASIKKSDPASTQRTFVKTIHDFINLYNQGWAQNNLGLKQAASQKWASLNWIGHSMQNYMRWNAKHQGTLTHFKDLNATVVTSTNEVLNAAKVKAKTKTNTKKKAIKPTK